MQAGQRRGDRFLCQRHWCLSSSVTPSLTSLRDSLPEIIPLKEYQKFALDLFDCRLAIQLTGAYGHVLSADRFRGFYAGKARPRAGAGLLTCTILDVKPHTQPTVALSGAKKVLADYPVFQYDVTRKMVADHGLNEDIIVQKARLAFFYPQKREMTAFACETSAEKNEQAIHTFLFLSVAFLTAEFGGLLLHAYGLVIDGLAAAIIGPPEAGKSTAGNLMQKDAVLSDDIIGITDIGGRPMAHASPLASSGITDGPCRAPLAALFFPVKSDQFDVRPIHPRDAFLRYLEEHADYVGRMVKSIRILYFKLAHTLFQKVPAYELHFPVDFVDTDRVRDVMSRFDI